jgi:hypothetical protein
MPLIKKVTIPYGVTEIELLAFYGCRALESIEIPDSVTSIGGWAFEGCINLYEIKVAENNFLFASQNGLLLNKERTELIQCPPGLSSAVIPASITSIDALVFFGCINLHEIKVAKNNLSFASQNGMLLNKARTELIKCPPALSKPIIPQSVTSIKIGAFAYCKKLKSIVIPNSVKIIMNLAFAFCRNLENIVIPDSVHYIAYDAFLSTKFQDIYSPKD